MPAPPQPFESIHFLRQKCPDPFIYRLFHRLPAMKANYFKRSGIKLFILMFSRFYIYRISVRIIYDYVKIEIAVLRLSPFRK